MQVISDRRFDFIEDRKLRNELRKSLLKAGRKKILLVEGYEDKIIFEIVYKDCLDKLAFIDTSMKASKQRFPGGCETVKNLLRKFVSHLPNEKRFYGIIDRDLKFDEEIEFEREQECYDHRLFIFFERYTLENYFIDTDILCEFLHAKSVDNQRLINCSNDSDELRKKIAGIVRIIFTCLTKIAAANLTIRSFDDEISFLEGTIKCNNIEQRLLNKLNEFPEKDIRYQFNCFESFITQSNSTHKFVSAKVYFSYQFNQHLKKENVDIQLNNHKSELSRILKDHLPDDFKELLNFIGE